ncbi:zonular occludens toxin domain-containing protein [Ralstonia solanacearum]|uniref:zonular occludens toxin domain-containing protein n=1 Tax=Ralstonia solanacearum TaxID=305 RepID=UPI001FF87A7D|nr:zonular occludens toxin domain-containing protein [Ralstonia solanacearum]MDB0564656.1 zonular occludens toxin domain-containing protein [Ralstonia solanacearum]MDB0577158.1 zonular occludens toxin domain-containing protein [Ralstonia solanacearum]
MYIFHEGLPRSGKSYEAMVKRIIPALQKGRKVYARLNGIDHERVAEASGVPVERVRELLHEIPEDKVLVWHTLVENDSLVILDEMQNFWPESVRNLPQDQIKAIAEHGHRGLDIIGMGQILKGKGGVNANWVNRCDQKIVFEKQNAQGSDGKYRWTSYKGRIENGRIKFVKVASGVERYDSKYFGTYATRVEGSDNADTYKDDRTNILKSALFRFYMPLGAIAFVFCLGVLWYLLQGGGMEKALTKGQPQSVTHTTTSTVTIPASGVAAQQPQPTGQPVQVASAGAPTQKPDVMADDYVASITAKWRPRLSALIASAGKARVVIEWYDEGYRVRERFSGAQLEEFGWSVVRSVYGEHVVLAKAGVRIAVTAWPMEQPASVSDQQKRDIREAGRDVVIGRSEADPVVSSESRPAVVPPIVERAGDGQVVHGRRSWSSG